MLRSPLICLLLCTQLWAAKNSYFVDPQSGTDSPGGGSIGSPWKTLNYAEANYTLGTDGAQINVKSSAADVLSTAETFGTRSPTDAAPLIVRGYTSAENDGGVGNLSGGDASVVLVNTTERVHFIDMKFSDTTTNAINDLGVNSTVTRCEFSDIGGNALSVGVGSTETVVNCYFIDCGVGSLSYFGPRIIQCTFKNGSIRDFSKCIDSRDPTVAFCEFILDGTSVAISQNFSGGGLIYGNSIYGGGSTAALLDLDASNLAEQVVMNNIITDCTLGIDWDNPPAILVGNTFWQCTTNYPASPLPNFAADNNTASSDPFPSAPDLDPGSVTEIDQNSWPITTRNGTNTFRWRGAIEPEEPAGGGGGPTAYGILSIETGIAR